MEPVCLTCQGELQDDGKTRKRNRPRKCQPCLKESRAKRLQEQPELVLAHRWCNACLRLYQNPPPSLYSAETVKYVMNRFEGKSVVSGNDDLTQLCVFPYFKKDSESYIPDMGHLVLVTSREAQSISRSKNREGRFPEEIQKLMHKFGN